MSNHAKLLKRKMTHLPPMNRQDTQRSMKRTLVQMLRSAIETTASRIPITNEYEAFAYQLIRKSASLKINEYVSAPYEHCTRNRIIILNKINLVLSRMSAQVL